MTLEIGTHAPDFSIPSDNGADISLSDYKGQWVVLYFYPKDSTPGCTKQACGFRDAMTQLNQLDCVVLGVSKDSVKKHQNFKQKQGLTFPLLSDEEGELCDLYGVWKEKSMYGKTFMGIERTTFLIDMNGVIRHVWPKVKVAGHVDDVVSVLSDIKKATI